MLRTAVSEQEHEDDVDADFGPVQDRPRVPALRAAVRHRRSQLSRSDKPVEVVWTRFFCFQENRTLFPRATGRRLTGMCS